MNKLILVALLGCVLIAATGAAEQESDHSLQSIDTEVLLEREAREAEPARQKNKNGRKKKGLRKRKQKTRKGKKGKGGKKGAARKGKKGKGKGRKGKKGKARKGKKGKARKGKKGKGRKSKKGKARKGKKGKGKGRKGKKGKGRRKKEKKLKKKKKGKKGKKGKKPKKATKGNKNRSVGRQTCDVTDACVSLAVTYMKIQKDKVANYQRQATRIGKQNKTGGSKSGKKDVFKSAMSRLIQVGGGNESAPECLGSKDNAAAKQIANLTTTLKKCSDNIKKACDPGNLPQPDLGKMETCKTKMDSFSKKLDECRKKTGKEACTCWNSTELSEPLATIKNCSLADEASAMAKGIKTCRSSFSTCRKFEDDISDVIFVCNIDPKALLSQMKGLTENIKALDELTALLTSLSARKTRYTRAIKTCTDISKKTDETVALVNSKPASKKIKTNIAELKAAAGSVTCTEDEKKQLKAKVAVVSAAKEKSQESLDRVAADHKAATGTVASAADISSAAECATDDCSAVAAAAVEAVATTTTAAPATTTTPAAAVVTKASGKKKRRQAVEDILKSKLV